MVSVAVGELCLSRAEKQPVKSSPGMKMPVDSTGAMADGCVRAHAHAWPEHGAHTRNEPRPPPYQATQAERSHGAPNTACKHNLTPEPCDTAQTLQSCPHARARTRHITSTSRHGHAPLSSENVPPGATPPSGETIETRLKTLETRPTTLDTRQTNARPRSTNA